MTAARWALEAGRNDVGAHHPRGHHPRGQQLVSDLLRNADLGPDREAPPPRDDEGAA